MKILKKFAHPDRNCPECARDFTPHREDQVFCGPHCRFRFNNKIKKNKALIKRMETMAEERINEAAEKQLEFHERLARMVENIDRLDIGSEPTKFKLNFLKRNGVDLGVDEGIYPFSDFPTSFFMVIGPYEVCLWDSDTVIIQKTK